MRFSLSKYENRLFLSYFLFMLIQCIQFVLSAVPIENCEVEILASRQSYKNQSVTCARCKAGYLLSSDSLTCLNQMIMSDEFAHCLQIGIFNECIVCECGYSIENRRSSTECVETPSELHGCQFFDEDNCFHPKREFLLVISDPLFASSSKTIQFSHSTNCQIKRDNTCIRCHPGFKLTPQNSCEEVEYQIVNSYYSYFEGEDLCSKDIRLIALNNRGVYPIIDNCVEHSLSEHPQKIECNKCMKGRIMNVSKSQCYKLPFELCNRVDDSNPHLCTECNQNENYYLLHLPEKGGGTRCVPRIRNRYDGCAVLSPISDTCSVCRFPFVLESHRCVMVSQVLKMREYQLESVQYSLILNCLIYSDESFVCIDCESGFVVTKSGTCVRSINKNCEIAELNGQCFQCKANMLMNSEANECLDVQVGRCLEVHLFTSECLKCYPGYYYSKMTNSCDKIQGCNSSNGIDMDCKQCSSTYYLVFDTQYHPGVSVCIRISDYKRCFESDGIKNQCLLCNRNFQLSDQNQCEPFVTHNNLECDVYGFYIQNSFDTYCTQHSEIVKENCFMLDPTRNRCMRCSNSYYVNEDTGICTSVKNCALSEGIKDVCVMAHDGKAYINSDGVAERLGCETNGRDPICARFNYEQSITLSEFRYAGQIIEEFEESQFDPIIVKNCFVIERVDVPNYGYFDRCLQCFNLFYVSAVYEGVCERLDMVECLVSDGKLPRCLYCRNNMIVDETTGKCVRSVSSISRCLKMDQFGCKKCESLFRLSETKLRCEAIENPRCASSNGVTGSCSCNSFILIKNLIHYIVCDIPFCQNLDYKTINCLRCLPGFSLISHNEPIAQCFITEDKNCKVREVGTNGDMICSQCQDGFYMNQLKERELFICTKILVPDCLQMKDNTLECIKCIEGYFPTRKGSCIRIKNCSTFTDRCTSCFSPFVLNSLGQCILIPHCKITEAKACIICESGFYLSKTGMSCISILNCASSAGRKNICESCKPFFRLLAFTCIPENPIENCVNYGVNGCIQCDSLFYVDSTSHSDKQMCTRISSNDFCDYSDGIHDSCLQCSTSGYGLTANINNSQQKCILIPNCVISDGISTCYFCSLLFYVKNISTSKQEDKVICQARNSIPNCSFYDSDGPTCEECESLFYLSPDRLSCVRMVEKPVDQCLLSDGKSNHCMICRVTQNYHQFSNQNESLHNRSDYFENYLNTCLFKGEFFSHSICSHNYYRYNNQCIPRRKLEFDNSNYCEKYHRDRNWCQICKRGYRFRYHELLPFGSYCEEIPASEKVANCIEYEHNSNLCKKCKQNNHISILEFVLDTSLNICVNVLEKRCEKARGNIEENNYELSDLSACKVQHVMFCEIEEEICKNCEKRKCKQCYNGYYISHEGQSCEEHVFIQGCSIYNKSIRDHCDKCEVEYLLFRNTCITPSDPNCELQHFYPEINDCQQCKQGFVQKKSSNNNNNNNNSSSNNTSIPLIETYVCVESSLENCKKMQDSICIECLLNFQLDKNSNCVRISINRSQSCLTFNEVNASQLCTSCKEGYFLNANQECLQQFSMCSIKNCLVYDQTSYPDRYQCMQCLNGHEVREVNSSESNSFSFHECNPVKNETTNKQSDDEINTNSSKNNPKSDEIDNKSSNGDHRKRESSFDTNNSLITSLFIITGLVCSVLTILIIRNCVRQRKPKKVLSQEQMLQNQIVHVQLQENSEER